MLSEKQKILLNHFSDSGNIYDSRIHVGVSVGEFNEWMHNTEFSEVYNNTKVHVLALINDESNMMARQYIKKILVDGSVKTTKTKTDSDGLTTCEEIEATIPPKYLEYALFKDTVENAIATLCSEGVLPEIVSRRLIQQLNENRKQTKKLFDVEDNTKVSDKKVMALIKTALGLSSQKESE